MPHRLAFIVLLLLVGAARADEVLLVNGDRLTGTVVRKEGEELILKTDYAGEIKIAWRQIARITTNEPMSLLLSDQSQTQANAVGKPPKPRKTESSTAADAQAKASQQPAAESQPREPLPTETPAAKLEPSPVPIDMVAYINAGPGVGILGLRWKGRINIGGSGSRGNSVTDNVHIEGEAVARQQRNRWTLNGVFDRGKDRDIVTRHNSRFSGKYDLFINPRWYGYAIATLEKDRFRDIDRRDTVGAGIGHQLIDTERTDLSLEGGLNYVHTNFDLAQDEKYPAARWAIKYEHRLFGTEMQVFHNHEILSDLADVERTFVRSQTGLRLPLLQRLMATAQLNVDYDNAPASNKAKMDRAYMFTVGYHW